MAVRLDGRSTITGSQDRQAHGGSPSVQEGVRSLPEVQAAAGVILVDEAGKLFFF